MRCTPTLRKKKALSGTYLAGALHLTFGTNPATTARLNHPYAIRAQTHQIRVLAEPFNNNKKYVQGQRSRGRNAPFRSNQLIDNQQADKP
jgi:hypothetical protein